MPNYLQVSDDASTKFPNSTNFRPFVWQSTDSQTTITDFVKPFTISYPIMSKFHWNPIRRHLSVVRSSHNSSTSPIPFVPRNYVHQRKHWLYNNLLVLLAALLVLTISHDMDILDTETRSKLKYVVVHFHQYIVRNYDTFTICQKCLYQKYNPTVWKKYESKIIIENQ